MRSIVRTVRVLGLVYCLPMLPGGLFAQQQAPAARWSFNAGSGAVARDSVSGTAGRIGGYYKYVPGVSGTALRFDGYTTNVTVAAANAPKLGNALSVESWVAINTYPWNWAPVVDQEKNHEAGYFFGIDAFGHFGLQLAVDGKWQSLTSTVQLPLKQWVHIAGTFEGSEGMAIYLNGKRVGELAVQGQMTPAADTDLLIGRIRHEVLPAEWLHPKYPVWYSFDGIFDEVEIFDRSLSPDGIEKSYAAVNAPQGEVLPWPKLPSGPPGAGPFGAYYCTLKYQDTWDRLRRIGPESDVVVRFDQSPMRLVFWQGTGYIPAWVTENGKWYTDEFLEVGARAGCPLGQDCEPMSDKQDRFSHVRILENNAARVVVHWRYAPVEVEQYAGAYADPLSGWFDWADEYYTVYPDGVAVRKMVSWSSDVKGKHEWQETIVINGPGQRPEDNINTDAISIGNMSGDTATYSWAPNRPKTFDRPTDPNIQVVNLKSKWKPFQIVSPVHSRMTPYGGREKTFALFPWWNHWPVAQIPSSGRSAVAPDRASHSSLSHIHWDPYASTAHTMTKIMLDGLTTKSAAELLPLAKSWLSPPKMDLQGQGFRSEGYDPTQRAYVIQCERTAGLSTVVLTLQADAGSPVFHPAFVIKDWGARRVRVKVDGTTVVAGKDLRIGHVRRLEGTDLVLWMPLQSVRPLRIELSAAPAEASIR